MLRRHLHFHQRSAAAVPCRTAGCYCLRSAAAVVPRHRLLIPTVCRQRSVPRSHPKHHHRSAAAAVLRCRYLILPVSHRLRRTAPPSIVISGLPPLLSCAAEYLYYWCAAATVPRRQLVSQSHRRATAVVLFTAASRALLFILVLQLLPPLRDNSNPCYLATLIVWNTWTCTFRLHIGLTCQISGQILEIGK